MYMFSKELYSLGVVLDKETTQISPYSTPNVFTR